MESTYGGQKMSIAIVKKSVVMNTIDCTVIEPCYLGITPEEVEEYMKEHPFPNDHEWYDKGCLLEDMQSTGAWTLPPDLSEKTKKWIEEMLQELW